MCQVTVPDRVRAEVAAAPLRDRLAQRQPGELGAQVMTCPLLLAAHHCSKPEVAAAEEQLEVQVAQVSGGLEGQMLPELRQVPTPVVVVEARE